MKMPARVPDMDTSAKATTSSLSCATSTIGPSGLAIAGSAVAGAAVVGTAAYFGSKLLRGLSGGGRVGVAVAAAAAGALALGLSAKVFLPSTRLIQTPTAATPPGAPTNTSATIVPATVTGISDPATASRPGPNIALKTIASDLSSPVRVTHAPGDTENMYVTEQDGKIVKVDAAGKQSTFLDIKDIVSSGGEQGLLSVAFSPNYATNGKLYVNYTDKNGIGNTQVVEYTAKDGKVDESTAKHIIEVVQPAANHNGGQLQFGPDSMLYIGMGDGGGAGDTDGHSQDPKDLLGKMLRIDVAHGSNGKNYSIPIGNPYADGSAGRPEIFASGVRNPWSFSFDKDKGDLWIGDVGQNKWEEVDVLPKGTGAGANLGWNVKEGTETYDAAAKLKGNPAITQPVMQYGHDAHSASITGGYVYRGDAIPSLKGYYVYADYAADKLRAMKVENGQVTDRRELQVGLPAIVGVGEDAAGELYVTSLGGKLAKITQGAGTEPTPDTTTGPATVTGGVDEPADPAKGHIEKLGTVPGAFQFDRTEIHVPAGTNTIQLTNSEGMPHNFHITVPGQNVPPSHYVTNGQTTEVTFKAEAGKTYKFVCDPHEAMNPPMIGTVVVDP
ncbi:MAG: PQQ-dependent sugar dehydrogenase [Thermoleophilia bacterium]|nr:PQQ-dependent sugar dehydrogenase [Thermoleophilia bacterium]